ncbi:hypothetical protein K488DRAFT_85312 [Vararia minispora EC-137]|uniref:Uncharacterized protein n=1 Tax=Vararia minispora EC-137 TaxID=1314806 RepID=A0ACB8QN96_9AGAM|nr:hypothetical protein K488DRAFT_85312 [Vararia minispora EC-137]
MDNKQKTLEALETFVQTQRSLLARTQEDIGRLNELRAQAENSESLLENLHVELADTAIARLDETPDPVGLRTLALDATAVQKTRMQPGTKQHSPLSPLQQFVKDHRAIILDPFIANFVPPSEDEGSEDEVAPEQARKDRARAQIRALRHRRIGEGGLTLPTGCEGVYVRRDTVDESADVDMDMDEQPPPPPVALEPMTIDTSVPARLSRTRSKSAPSSWATAPKAKRPPLSPPAAHPNIEADGVTQPSKASRHSKQSETYKQAWSMSEQHLLERLLVEIPDGEKNRWAKISRAMHGRRTPRQVASRVQKYFEKLKRFGVDIANGGGSSATADG